MALHVPHSHTGINQFFNFSRVDVRTLGLPPDPPPLDIRFHGNAQFVMTDEPWLREHRGVFRQWGAVFDDIKRSKSRKFIGKAVAVMLERLWHVLLGKPLHTPVTNGRPPLPQPVRLRLGFGFPAPRSVW